MATPITSIASIPLKRKFDNVWDQSCDPRIVDFWLMSRGPWKLLSFTAIYIMIIYFGQRIMKSRKPYELRYPMFIYNILMVLINMFFLYEAFVWVEFGSRLLDFKFPSSNDRSPQIMRNIQMFYYYQWTKFIDYFDTFFFILRKKNKQLTFLHIYHHIAVPIIGWQTAWTGPTMPVMGLFSILNCFCHVIMYSYYALATLGPKLQPYLWWKKYITQIQILQFAIIGIYGICIQLFHTDYPFSYRIAPIIHSLIFLALFGDFYIKSYREQKKLN